MNANIKIDKYLSLYPNDNCNKSLIRIKYWLSSIGQHNFKSRYGLITEMFETIYLLNDYFVNHDDKSTLLFQDITDLIMHELNQQYKQWFHTGIDSDTSHRIIAKKVQSMNLQQIQVTHI